MNSQREDFINKKEKASSMSNGVQEKNTLQFLVNKANTL